MCHDCHTILPRLVLEVCESTCAHDGQSVRRLPMCTARSTLPWPTAATRMPTTAPSPTIGMVFSQRKKVSPLSRRQHDTYEGGYWLLFFLVDHRSLNFVSSIYLLTLTQHSLNFKVGKLRWIRAQLQVHEQPAAGTCPPLRATPDSRSRWRYEATSLRRRNLVTSRQLQPTCSRWPGSRARSLFLQLYPFFCACASIIASGARACAVRAKDTRRKNW